MSYIEMFEEKQGNFVCEIVNYRSFVKGDTIQGPYYKTDNVRWSLIIQKRSCFIKSVKKNSVFYTVLGTRKTREPIRVKIRVHVISATKMSTLLSETETVFDRFCSPTDEAVLGAETLINEFVVNDRLTLRFNVTYSKINKHTTLNHFVDCGFSSESSRYKSCIETLHSDIRSYWSKQDSGDVLLRVEQQEFRVHKFILSARSPVFQRMFENDMRENLTNTVIIPDVSAAVMKQMVSYMYGEELDETSSDTCIGLYAAAEKYCLLDLKQRCTRILVKNLSPDIACEVASVAHLHQDVQLLGSVKSYISSHAAKVICTKGWVELLTKVPALASDLAVSVTTTQ